MPFIIEHIQESVSLIYMLELKEIAGQLLSDSYVLLDRNPGTCVWIIIIFEYRNW